MAIYACIDDSADGVRQKIFTLGGYIATDHAWTSLTKEWEEGLKGWGISAYKFNREHKTSQTEIDAFFYRIIEAHDIPVAVDILLDIPTLQNAANRLPWKRPNGVPSPIEKMIRNPYFFSTKWLMMNIFGHAQEMGFNEPIDFIYDEQNKEKEILTSGWDYFRHTMPKNIKPMMGALPSFKSDNDFLPLQAADLLVSHVRQYEENVGDSINKNPFPWGTNKTIKRYSTRIPEKTIVQELEWFASTQSRDQLQKFLDNQSSQT